LGLGCKDKAGSSMNKFQNVSFRSLGDFFDYLPENELRVVESLRDLILDTLPEPKEKLSFNVPYYQCYRNVCFIWPGSIGWGGVKDGVLLGFVQGHLMMDDEHYLEKGNRKYVRTRRFCQRQEIDFDKVRSLLHEAAAIDEELRSVAKKRRK